MEEDKGDLPQKDQVSETIIDIFIRVIGFIKREEVSRTTNPAKDFYIDTDDLSIFILEVEKHFHISASQDEWFSIDGTLESVANLVLRHLPK
jgi:acyl carrier protein